MASIQEQLQAARETAERKHPVSLPVPGYKDDALVLRYRPPDWDISREFVQAQIAAAPTNVELEAIADALLRSCIGAEAHLDGVVHEIPHKLGTGLAEYLGLDIQVDGQRVSNRQAVFLLFPDDMDLVRHWNELIVRSRDGKSDVEDEIVGESQAG